MSALASSDRRRFLDRVDALGPEVATEKLTLAEYHSHVPTLVECRVLEYDKEEGRLTEGPNYERAMNLKSSFETIDANRKH